MHDADLNPGTTLNLGVLAHIDAGKTSLTERLLLDNGAISELGSVDAGSTQTDTGEIERERGITIRSAVAPFAVRGVGGLQINLVDTPGHPDFIAEVERALSVLDGAVLVLSAVEGVQAQTRVLLRSLRRLRLPTLLFVNKIDRTGARSDSLLADIRAGLTPDILAMSSVRDAGTAAARTDVRSLERVEFRMAAAEALAEHDDALLAQLVAGELPSADDVRALLARQCGAGLLHPVFFGSALTGEGIAALTDGIAALLRPPRTAPEPAASAPAAAGTGPRGTVFAVERTGAGEKVAYLRLFSGEVRERQRVTYWQREPGGKQAEFSGRITGLDVVGVPTAGAPGAPDSRGAHGAAGGEPGRRLTAGGIGRVRGLPGIRVGDRLGAPDDRLEQFHFSPPSLETVVRAGGPGQQARLHSALLALADEDPLIRTRAAGGGATSVLLYGAVQQEVLAARLERDFGLEVVFEPVRPVYFERPAGRGEARTEIDRHGANDFLATVGLRVEPAPRGAGVTFARETEWGALPRAFHRAIEESALRTLQQGLYGWEVTDCTVTLTRTGYIQPLTVAAHFRQLTPLVLMRALQRAGSRVFEPCQTLEVEIPEDALNAVIGCLVPLGAEVTGSTEAGSSWLITAELPVRRVQEFQKALPGLTRGEGAVWSRPGQDRPVRGPAPTRPRTDGNPLNRDEYMRFLADRSLADRSLAGGGPGGTAG
ncbi:MULTISPECIES: translation factor GTPase family protein [unclassified Streptomyces]|uniref:translation factor GTPase family protein n=1 Tax=unclassified Streptomyces TaxID=2593676 RepID=UPI002E0F748B|nr:TetM/TetW/TetO/TetS family tetracycline resistance ribosomal protection protein [Streptomyces sp. NBC_01197]WSS50538.1 TetM/TetW/TetO/TetS family tetracycline resistance ribosomal protection protein [Streptomyces sp. NBC_01180]